MSAEADIEALRLRIDAIDDRLVDLVARRLEIAEALGEAKAAGGFTGRDPEREAEIVARLSATGAAPPELIALVWQALFTASRSVQARTDRRPAAT